MRALVVLALLAAPARADSSPIDAVARVARGRAGEALTLTFQREACTLTATLGDGEHVIPVRKVSWSMTKETDGTGDAIVTARCAASAKACVTGGKASPRFSFRLATSAREARTMLRDLKSLSTHCP